MMARQPQIYSHNRCQRTANITVTVTDADNGTVSKPFTVTVNPVNDIPSLTATNPTAVNEDAGAQTVTGWATFNAGAANESAQTPPLILLVISALLAYLQYRQQIDANGNLTYTPPPMPTALLPLMLQFKIVAVLLTAGVDTSAVQNFSITVNPVNDKPSFSNLGNQTLTSSTNTAQTVSNWANTVIFGQLMNQLKQLANTPLLTPTTPYLPLNQV